MRLIVYILEGAAILFFLSQIIMAAYIKRTEEQAYSVIQKDGDIEIRHYPSSIMATVNMQGSYDQVSSNGFRKLAGYIFGGNQQEQKIAMTSPVWMEPDAHSMQMSFVMPSEYKLEDLPKPYSADIQLHQTDPDYKAVIRFGGYISDKRIAEKANELRAWLKQNHLEFEDEPLVAGYNPPFQVLGRRNEVAFVITSKI